MEFLVQFAIRDDDLNYYFNPDEIEKNYHDIWKTCPVSMSVVPLIVGNWPERIKLHAKWGPGVMAKERLEQVTKDSRIFPIGENVKLLEYLHQKIKQKYIYLTIHGIHHINQDDVIPQFKNNYGIGAEFHTTRDLTRQLKSAIEYLELLFNQKIEVFTAPQNMLNKNGIRAVMNNNLSICSNPPRLKDYSTLQYYGPELYIRTIIFKLLNNGHQYPFTIKNNGYKFIGHHSLQPGTDIKKLLKNIDLVQACGGNFVLSTHSHGFNIKMVGGSRTMGEVFRDIIEYASKVDNIKFVSLKDIFDL